MDQISTIKPSEIQNDGTACPACGSSKVSDEWIDDEFTYGNGKDAVALTARIPLCHCETCGLDFTDWRGEELRHDAVCRHFNLLTPKEIEAIRDRHGLTQHELAKISRIGRASLARWESGNVLQNGSSDSLIYLLHFTDNLLRLRQRNSPQHANANVGAQDIMVRRFRALSESQVLDVRRESASFHLFVSA